MQTGDRSSKKSNSKIQDWCPREKWYRQKRGFEDGSLLFRDKKNASSFVTTEGTVNVQVATASRQLKMQPGVWNIRPRDEDIGVIHRVTEKLGKNR